MARDTSSSSSPTNSSGHPGTSDGSMSRRDNSASIPCRPRPAAARLRMSTSANLRSSTKPQRRARPTASATSSSENPSFARRSRNALLACSLMRERRRILQKAFSAPSVAAGDAARGLAISPSGLSGFLSRKFSEDVLTADAFGAGLCSIEAMRALSWLNVSSTSLPNFNHFLFVGLATGVRASASSVERVT